MTIVLFVRNSYLSKKKKIADILKIFKVLEQHKQNFKIMLPTCTEMVSVIYFSFSPFLLEASSQSLRFNHYNNIG